MSQVGLPYIRPDQLPQTLEQLEHYKTAPPLVNTNEQNNQPQYEGPTGDILESLKSTPDWVWIGVGLLVFWKILA